MTSLCAALMEFLVFGIWLTCISEVKLGAVIVGIVFGNLIVIKLIHCLLLHMSPNITFTTKRFDMNAISTLMPPVQVQKPPRTRHLLMSSLPSTP